MILELVFPGKTKERYLAEGIDDFVKRLGRFAQVEIRIARQWKDTGSLPAHKIKEMEARGLVSLISPGAVVVVLDRQGVHYDSEAFAALLNKWHEESRRTISFVIGGHHGLADSVLNHATLRLSLSKMTFTHELTRLLLLEQLYRGFNILAGTGYHK